MVIARSIAYRTWISDISSGAYVKQEGFNPNYVEADGRQISRINLLATVVAKFLSEDGNYGAVTLDDGTDTIRAKAFGPDIIKIKNIEIGALVRFVGKIKEYNEERYLAPDFAAEVKDPNWLIVWKLELGKPAEIAVREEVAETEESPKEAEDSTSEEKSKGEEPSKDLEKKPELPKAEEEADIPNFIEIIKKCDKGEGAKMADIVKESKLSEDDVKAHIVELLKQGEIYEPRKGKLKVL